ncbi:MAG: FG-GAP repeat protein [Candidatus Sulfotelmatobacter sp.]
MRTLQTLCLVLACLALSLSAFASGQPPLTYDQIAKLTAPDGAANDEFGNSVAIDGNTIVVGKNDGTVQSAFVYENNSGTVTQVAELTPSDGAPGDRFGYTVAISGNVIVVAAIDHANHDPENTGSLYVYVEPAGGWSSMTETAELNLMQAGAELGRSIGTTGNEVVSLNSNNGTVVVWNEPSGGWVSSSKPNAELLTGSPGNNLANVAISGNVIVAGCPQAFQYGATFLYVKPANGWNTIGITPTARLLGSSGDYGGGGQAVAISGNTVVGSTGASLFVFVKPSSGWANMTQNAILTDSNAQNDLYAIAISGGTVVAGDPAQLVGVNPEQGAVFVFMKPSGGWKNLTTANAELVASDGNIGDNLGTSVAVSGGTVVAGAPFAQIGSNAAQGAAYVFAQQ